MGTFPDDPWAGFRKPGFPVPPGTTQLGPRTVSTTIAPAPGTMAPMTLDALMARQKELASQRNPIGDMTSPISGAAYALREGLQGWQQGMAAGQENQARQLLAQTMGQIDPKVGPTPEQMQTIFSVDPELGTAIYGKQSTPTEQWTPIPTPQGESGQWFQNQNGDVKKVGGGEGAGGPKESDVNSMADDFANVPDVKNLQNAQSMWVSMQDAATRDTAQADLNMVIALAKLFDPTSVVRTEEGEMVRDTGGLPAGLYGSFLKLTGTPGARLDRATRRGMMQEGYSRMNGYFQGVKSAADWFTEKAKRRGYDPADIVRPLPAPQPFDLEKVVGSDAPTEPPAPDPNKPAPAPHKDDAGNTVTDLPDGGKVSVSPDGIETTYDKDGRVIKVRRVGGGGG